MATQQTRSLARFMMAPSVVLLFVWMIVPLVITVWFSFQQYNPLNPIRDGFVGFSNYALFYSNPAFLQSILNTLVLVGSVLLITVIGGILLALLIDQPMWGQGIVRILVISPFFVMPPVAALVWKNMIMHPQYGVFADIAGPTDTVKDFSSTRVGYGTAGAANQLFVFGGDAAGGVLGNTISATFKASTPDAPDMENNSWNNGGISMTSPRYLMGSPIQSAFIFLIAGDTGAGVTTSTETVVW